MLGNLASKATPSTPPISPHTSPPLKRRLLKKIGGVARAGEVLPANLRSCGARGQNQGMNEADLILIILTP